MKNTNWDVRMANAWKNYKPPTRPSKDELEVFKSFIDKRLKNNKDIKILILGSTPEFRDLASKAKLVPYVADYSKNNFLALRLLKKYKGKEIFLNQDWKNLKINKKFDLILAEASLNMVEAKNIDKVLRNVKNHLKDDGLFIAKTWNRIPKYKLSLKKVVNTYRKKYPKGSFKWHMTQYTYSYLYNIKKNEIAQKDFYLAMKRFYKNKKITKKEFDCFNGLSYETTKMKVYFPLKREIINKIKKHFKIQQTITPKPIGVNVIPIYVLGK